MLIISIYLKRRSYIDIVHQFCSTDGNPGWDVRATYSRFVRLSGACNQ